MIGRDIQGEHGAGRADVKGRAGFALVVGLALAVGGGTRAMSALAARAAHPVVHALGLGQAPDDASLARGVAALERSAEWRGTPARRYGDLALLQFELARREQANPGQFVPRINAGVAAQRTALALAPADGSGWARLVYAQKLRTRQRGDPAAGRATSNDAGSLGALEMAFLTRDLSFSLVRFRLAAALDQWAMLRPWLRTAARAEVLELTRYGTRGMDALVDLYLASPHPAVIDEELAAAPQQQAYFEQRLARRLKQR